MRLVLLVFSYLRFVAVKIKDKRTMVNKDDANENPTIECFVCGSELKLDSHSLPDEENNPHIIHPLYGGLWFRSSGNYGSSVFDPMSKEELQIAICDECLMAKKNEVTHIYDIRSSTKSKSKPWNPEDD